MQSPNSSVLKAAETKGTVQGHHLQGWVAAVWSERNLTASSTVWAQITTDIHDVIVKEWKGEEK